MQNMETLQLIKEQLKIKTLELKKQEIEKNKISDKIKGVLALNQKKITELKTQVKEKDDALQRAQSRSYGGSPSSAPAVAQPAQQQTAPAVDLSKGGETYAAGYDPEMQARLQAQMEDLKKKDAELSDLVRAETAEKERLNKEKTVLLKELKRLRKDPETVDGMKAQMQKIKEEMDKLKDKSISSSSNMEDLLKEKNDIIASYEKMLYGEAEPGQEGMMPSEIIADLKVELKERLEEKKKMTMELEDLKNLSLDLEMKLTIAQEAAGSGRDKHDSGQVAESRSSTTSEFGGSLEAFLVTYSDMITLILTIFVLMYSFSKIDTERVAAALSSFQDKKLQDTMNVLLTKEEVRMLHRVRELIKDNVDPDSLIRGDIETILVTLPNEEIFAPGSAELIEGAEETIQKAIEKKMQDGVKQVLVDGHTDDVAMKSEKFPSNWELSTSRASRVARFITEKMHFPPQHLVVSGYGPHRPIKENTSDENRAANRRVEIKILKDRAVMEAERKKKEAEEAAKAPPDAAKDVAKPPAGGEAGKAPQTPENKEHAQDAKQGKPEVGAPPKPDANASESLMDKVLSFLNKF